MQQPESPTFFDQKHASEYDKQFIKLAPLREALHFLTSAVLSDLPVEARVLCVGAGTGAELLHLAQRFPQWRFTAVDPSGPMLEICRRRAEQAGISSRCAFHEGYLDSLPPTGSFDAATSILVSQFILAPEARTLFFRGIAQRLKPGGHFVNADLASGATAANYPDLLELWFRMMHSTGVPTEKLDGMRVAYQTSVSLLPLSDISGMMTSAGFAAPVLFLQTVLIHAWHARRTGD
jgi:tRNA (cmo5U34)-methyltransferase